MIPTAPRPSPAAALGSSVLLLLAACASAPATDSPAAGERPAAGASKDAPDEGEALADARDELRGAEHGVVKAERALARAREKVGLGEIQVQEKLRAAEESVRAAEEAQWSAAHARRAFASARELRTRRAMLGVERAEHRLLTAQTDLAGIIAIYEEEREARAAEEIIRRNRMSVRFAEAELELQKATQESLVGVELPGEERAHDEKLRVAEARLAGARADLEEARRAAELEGLEHAASIADAEFELGAARRKLEKTRRALARAEVKAKAGAAK